jgi:hypothetical protein
MISVVPTGLRPMHERCTTCKRTVSFNAATASILDRWHMTATSRECPECVRVRQERERVAAMHEAEARALGGLPPLPYTLGPQIGMGGSKVVFAVVGRPDIVIRVLRGKGPRAIGEEHQRLRRLDAVGFPVPRVVMLGRAPGGCPADVLERFAASTKDPTFTPGMLASARADLARIRAGLDAVAVGDLQLLTSPGRAVVADPGQLIARGEHGFDETRAENLRELDAWEVAA